jgi:hypothetical protein
MISSTASNPIAAATVLNKTGPYHQTKLKEATKLKGATKQSQQIKREAATKLKGATQLEAAELSSHLALEALLLLGALTTPPQPTLEVKKQIPLFQARMPLAIAET